MSECPDPTRHEPPSTSTGITRKPAPAPTYFLRCADCQTMWHAEVNLLTGEPLHIRPRKRRNNHPEGGCTHEPERVEAFYDDGTWKLVQ